MGSFLDLITKDMEETARKREEVEAFILDHFQAEDIEEAYDNSGLREEVAAVSVVAGAGTRWLTSLEEHPDLGKQHKVTSDDPRCAARVDNYLATIDGEQIPIGAYNFDAVFGLGLNVVIYGNGLDMIEQDIVGPFIRNDPFRVEYVHQDVLPGKPKVSGHGDAFRQAREFWQDSTYVITNFGNDTNSRNTAMMSLLGIYLLNEEGSDISHILPVTYVPSPSYRVIMDGTVPTEVRHAKLRGDEVDESNGFTNVGVRIYRTEDAKRVVDQFWAAQQNEGSYASLNPNGNDEFALDHIDARLMEERTARLMPVSSASELCPAKKLTDIPKYMAAMKQVLQQDGQI